MVAFEPTAYTQPPVSPSGRPGQVRMGSGKNNLSAPQLSPLGRDQCQFGATSSNLTVDQRRQHVNQMATQLFAGVKSKKELITRFQQQYGNRIRLCDGQSEPWVNDVCTAFGPQAFVKAPDSMLFNDDPKDLKGFETVDAETLQLCGTPQAKASMTHYFTKVLPQLHQQRQIGVFMAKQSSLSELKHELYHCLQYLHGVPVTVPDKAIDQQAEQVINQGAHPLTGIHFIDGPIQIVKRIGQWGISLIKGLFSSSAPTLTNTVGEAIRRKMQLEKDVDLFMLKNPSIAGTGGWFNHLFHYMFESQLKYQMSYQYDH